MDLYTEIVLMQKVESLEPATDLLTTEQVMDILISDARLRRRAATCVLPAVRVGGLTYFRKSDLDAWRERAQGQLS